MRHRLYRTGLFIALVISLLVVPGQAQAQSGGSGVFNHFVYLPLIIKPSPYPYPLCFGEDIDWEGDRQSVYDGGNDSVTQDMPVTIEYPTTCIGWIHLDDTLFAPYPDADFWHLGVPAGDTGYVKITATGLKDGMVLNWGYCNAEDCASDFDWIQDSSGTGVRTITIPLKPEGGVIGIQPTWDDQFDNENYYILTVEKVP